MNPKGTPSKNGFSPMKTQPISRSTFQDNLGDSYFGQQKGKHIKIIKLGLLKHIPRELRDLLRKRKFQRVHYSELKLFEEETENYRLLLDFAETVAVVVK